MAYGCKECIERKRAAEAQMAFAFGQVTWSECEECCLVRRAEEILREDSYERFAAAQAERILRGTR